jgi:hypothetical protein
MILLYEKLQDIESKDEGRPVGWFFGLPDWPRKSERRSLWPRLLQNLFDF